MTVIETAANTDPLGPVTLRKASISTLEMELIHSQHAGGADQDDGEEGEEGEEGGGDGPSAPTITGPASFALAIQERFAALLPQIDKPKLFSGMSGPDLRFNFGLGGEDGEGGPRVTEKISQGFEDMGEGMRAAGENLATGFSKAGEKFTGGISKGFDAVKNTLQRKNSTNDASSDNEGNGNSGHYGNGNGGYGNSDDEGVQEAKAPKEKAKMGNPFAAIAAAGGAVGGALGRAASPLRDGLARAVSPLRGKQPRDLEIPTEKETNQTVEKGKMAYRLQKAFGGV